MSIKAAILEKANNGGDGLEFTEYTNLILDEMTVEMISEEDCAFLELFTACKCLSLNSCHLKSLANLPQLESLQRLELNDNKINSCKVSTAGNQTQAKTTSEASTAATDTGKSEEAEMKLVLWPQNLTTLKLANNQISDIEELIESLKPLSKLTAIDISSNPCSDK